MGIPSSVRRFSASMRSTWRCSAFSSGLVARFNPRKLVTQQLWLYLCGADADAGVPCAAVLREKFCRNGRPAGRVAAAVAAYMVSVRADLLASDPAGSVPAAGQAGAGLACLGMALAVGWRWLPGWWTGPSRWCGYLHSTRFMRAGCSARSWTGWPRLRRSTARCGLWLRRGWCLAMERIFSGCCGLTRSWTTARSCSTM